MRGKPGHWPPATQGVPTPTSSSSWSPRHPAFSSSEFWLATDTSGWLRSPALSSSWRWEHQQTHGRGGLSPPGRYPPRPPRTPPLPLPAVAASETGDAGASGAGTGECPAAARAPWPGPGPPGWTAPPPVREGGSQGTTRFPGPREPDPHFSARAPHGAGTTPHTEFWEGGTPGFQHPFCWTISAGPSTSLLVSPPQVCIPLSRPGSAAKGRGPVVGVDPPGPAQGHTHQPFHAPPTGPGPAHLPLEELPVGGAAREEEHVDEVDQDAGGRGSAGSREAQPLVDDQEDQVAEQPQQEDQLGEGLQQQPVPLAEVPGAGARGRSMGEPGQQATLALLGTPNPRTPALTRG